MARRTFRHCRRSAAIHGLGSSTMDRHGLRPRDDEGGPSWRGVHSVIAGAARQSMALTYPRWIATACGLAMTKVARHGEASIPSLRGAARQSTALVHPRWIATACGLAMTKVARHGEAYIPSLQAQRGNPRP
ncbi:hypothetical protein LP417_31710 [Polaromonas sp. P1-6]|nr:hypothetical protein LP417_31710 [Polaromonas sp. P1-6]